MKRKHTQAMTLRLDPTISDLLNEAAWRKRISKAAYIRGAIKTRLGNDPQTNQKETNSI
jgi:predicted HicB family RNase H-like nuclease